MCVEPTQKQKVKMLLSYEGTDFGGWQRQTTEKPTIQGCLEKALSRLFDQPVHVIGAGRTDAGVHAVGQVAHFEAPKDPTKFKLHHALQSLTPPSIVIRKLWLAPEDFHSLASAEEKIYKYFILNRKIPSALRRHHFTWISRPLDIDYLNEAAQYLVKTQDFKSFQSSGSDPKTTVRTVTRAQWTQKNGGLLEFSITGSGFLKQMVRNIVGTMLDLSYMGAPTSDMQRILDSLDRQKAKTTAPPEGLYLYHVKYSKELDNRCRQF